ncbi:MAG: hypothetical protein WCP06_02590 [Verrucomicrobiota bacterium]
MRSLRQDAQLPVIAPTTTFKPVRKKAAATEFKAADFFSCSPISSLMGNFCVPNSLGGFSPFLTLRQAVALSFGIRWAKMHGLIVYRHGDFCVGREFTQVDRKSRTPASPLAAGGDGVWGEARGDLANDFSIFRGGDVEVHPGSADHSGTHAFLHRTRYMRFASLISGVDIGDDRAALRGGFRG